MTLSLVQIDQGIDALVENATSLVKEVQLLLRDGAYARTYTLAHLAREELSRIAMLEASGLRMLAERPVDWKQLMRRLRDHKAKLTLQNVENSLLLKGFNVHPPAVEMRALAAHTADVRNDWKNASLYVDLRDGKFVTPAAVVTELRAVRTLRLAEIRLGECVRRREELPRFAQSEIGSLRHVPDIDSMMQSDAANELLG